MDEKIDKKMEENIKQVEDSVEINRYKYLPKVFKFIFIMITALVFSICFAYSFNFRPFGRPILAFGFYWVFIGFISFLGYFILPARKKDRKILPWYDIIAAFTVMSISIYFSTKAWQIFTAGWVNIPLGFILIFLMLEPARRTGGLIFAVLCGITAAYPLYSSFMPGLLWGPSFDLSRTIGTLIFTKEGMMGIVTRVTAEILPGFIVFAGVLLATGGGDFFINLAASLLGKRRGGTAKVSVLASAFFGSLSGSSSTNVVATGSFTIPAMKKQGFDPHYAGAIEAVASSGGVIMPPVMGSIVFIMAEMAQIEYSVIMIAAILPSVLYFLCLLVQVDFYAARNGFKGMAKDEIPPLKETLKDGWHYLIVLISLIYGLVYLRFGYQTPWYSAGLLIVLSFFKKKKLTKEQYFNCIKNMGELLSRVGVMLFAVNFIYGGLLITGVTGSFVSGLVSLGGGNLFLLLFVGILVCYVLGMVDMAIPGYIFLSITLAPAAIQLGNLNVLAMHLFIIYYSMLAAITPPVALSAFVGAALAGAAPMKTAVRSMALGCVIYFLPIFFLFEPVLILQGNILPLIHILPVTIIGIIFIASGFERYFWGIGKLEKWTSPFLVIGGFLIAFPSSLNWMTTYIGIAIVIITFFISYKRKHFAKINNKKV